MKVLEGVRVFELGIAIASPYCGRTLSFHGADVFKIESPTNPEIVRLIGSSWLRDNEEQAAALPDSSPYLSELNSDKRSVALDLKQKAALDAAKRLILCCDVFLANYGDRALVDLGLDFESVRAIKPDIVYVQLPGFGTDPSSPYYPYVAWGPNQAPLVGIDDLTGHAGYEPAGIATVAPPDYLSALHATFAVLAGLEERDRTGEGVHVDIPQFESTVALLGPFAMDLALTGRSQSRIGNRSLWFAPEGVYPSQGNERWIAISVDSEDAWQALRPLAGDELVDDDRFADNELRMQNTDALDAAMALWTARYVNDELAARLQAVGVTAHIVSTNEDLIGDAQVQSRGWYAVNKGPRFTREVYATVPTRLSVTPGSTERGGPSTGEHTMEVLTEVAGLTREEVQSLIDEEAAFTMIEPDLVIDRPHEEWLHVMFRDVPDTRDI